LEELPFPSASIGVVISNGVVNLCPDKERVFAEAARVLIPGGRLAIADIVAARPLPVTVTSNASLWSACIGGAAPERDHRAAVEAAGFTISAWRDVPRYKFLTVQATAASTRYAVHAITLAARLT